MRQLALLRHPSQRPSIRRLFFGMELRARLTTSARMFTASLERIAQEQDDKVVIADPDYLFTADSVLRLTGWARAGKLVVIPRSALYTDAARDESLSEIRP